MAQLLNAAKRKVIRGSGSYEDLDGNVEPIATTPPESMQSTSGAHTIYGGDELPDMLGQEIEMTSVSVVPDGNFVKNRKS